jgi:hypothetical protein
MRYVLYLLILVGVVYGAMHLFGGDDGTAGGDSAALSANGESGEPAPADSGTSPAGSGAESRPATANPAPAAVSVAKLVKDAEAALVRSRGAPTRARAHEELDAARRGFSDAYLRMAVEGKANELRARVDELNDLLLDSEEVLPGKSALYTFKANDRLWTLCNKVFPKQYSFKVEPGFLLWLNGVSDARRIREGQVFKVPLEELTLLVSKRCHKLWVLLGGVYLREFPVGLGLNDKTPEGVFEIETKIEKPDWYFDGRKIPYGHAENPLGTHWMGFVNTRRAVGYGIHGTDEPETVGKSVSQGCVRMRNADVGELFGWVPRGTKVTIRR